MKKICLYLFVSFISTTMQSMQFHRAPSRSSDEQAYQKLIEFLKVERPPSTDEEQINMKTEQSLLQCTKSMLHVLRQNHRPMTKFQPSETKH